MTVTLHTQMIGAFTMQRLGPDFPAPLSKTVNLAPPAGAQGMRQGFQTIEYLQAVKQATLIMRPAKSIAYHANCEIYPPFLRTFVYNECVLLAEPCRGRTGWCAPDQLMFQEFGSWDGGSLWADLACKTCPPGRSAATGGGHLLQLAWTDIHRGTEERIDLSSPCRTG